MNFPEKWAIEQYDIMKQQVHQVGQRGVGLDIFTLAIFGEIVIDLASVKSRHHK
jgi:hypothetical protein